jgi:hypothetical protein
MKASTAEKHGYKCPECGDLVTLDKSGRGFVRHIRNNSCKFERGQRDARKVRERTRIGSTAIALAALLLISCTESASSGPTDREIRKLFADKGFMFDAEFKISRGDLMEATGEGAIPKGTVLYPIRFVHHGDTLVTGDFYFYQDAFHDWQIEVGAIRPQ